MALVKCAECGNDVSDKAASCPRCGAPINQSYAAAPPPPPPAAAPPRRKTSKLTCGCFILLLLLGLGTYLTTSVGDGGDSAQQTTTREPGPNDPVDRSGQYIAISNGHYSIKGTNDWVKIGNKRGQNFISSYAVKKDEAWLLINPDEWDVMSEAERLQDLRFFANRSWMKDMGLTRSYFLLRGKEVGQIVKTGPDKYEWQPKE